jgi:hypothetical protein
MLRDAGEPGPTWYWQLEHQLLVSGANAILFVTSDGTEQNHEYRFYQSKPERRAALIAGWQQFAADLAAYKPEQGADPAPTGRAPDTLPALHIAVTGQVTASNLAEFKATALAVFKGINRALETDQDFADAERTVKWCGDVEERLAAAKQHALSQTASIDALFKAIDDISAEARRTRLDLEKLVKARKDQIRSDVVASGVTALSKHIATLNEAIGKPLMPAIAADFAGAIKGKKTLSSLKDAVDTELAVAKISANDVAARIQINLRALQDQLGYSFLFPDVPALVLKQPDDLAAVIAARVAQHKEEAAKREAEAAEKAASVAPAPAPTPAAVVPIIRPAAPAADNGKVLKLGEINARLAPIQISADGLATLGFTPATTDKSAKLYRVSDYPRICEAIAQHVMNIAQLEAA